MSFAININNKEVVAYTDKLERLNRSDFPIAVRQTLNDLAFDVKQVNLLRSAKKQFIVRVPSFFKRFSSVLKADGFNVSTMHSKVGIKPGSNIAAKNLAKQEKGGTVAKSVIHNDQARISRNKGKRVSKKYYFGANELVRGKHSKSRGSKSSDFVAAAAVGKRTGKLAVLNNETAYFIKKVGFSGKGRKRKANIKSVPIWSFENSNQVSLKAQPFLLPASKLSLKKAEVFYIENAKKRFEKRLKT